ncbi:MAG: class I SAM-dependent methyltransferase [Candidatus Caldarchaeum sp.]
MKTFSKLVPFVPTPVNVVERMLDLAGVEEGEKVYDLGCGDGRIILMAASKYGARGVGYELRPNLVHHVRERVRVLRLDDMVTVVNRDLAKASLNDADVVTLYLTTPVLQRIRPQLEEALSKGARIVCHNFPIPGLIPSEVETKSGRRLYLYTKVQKI